MGRQLLNFGGDSRESAVKSVFSSGHCEIPAVEEATACGPEGSGWQFLSSGSAGGGQRPQVAITPGSTHKKHTVHYVYQVI